MRSVDVGTAARVGVIVVTAVAAAIGGRLSAASAEGPVTLSRISFYNGRHFSFQDCSAAGAPQTVFHNTALHVYVDVGYSDWEGRHADQNIWYAPNGKEYQRSDVLAFEGAGAYSDCDSLDVASTNAASLLGKWTLILRVDGRNFGRANFVLTPPIPRLFDPAVTKLEDSKVPVFLPTWLPSVFGHTPAGVELAARATVWSKGWNLVVWTDGPDGSLGGQTPHCNQCGALEIGAQTGKAGPLLAFCAAGLTSSGTYPLSRCYRVARLRSGAEAYLSYPAPPGQFAGSGYHRLIDWNGNGYRYSITGSPDLFAGLSFGVGTVRGATNPNSWPDAVLVSMANSMAKLH